MLQARCDSVTKRDVRFGFFHVKSNIGDAMLQEKLEDFIGIVQGNLSQTCNDAVNATIPIDRICSNKQ